MKSKKSGINLQEWVRVTKDNSVKVLFGKNKKISSFDVVIKKSYKPNSLL